MLVSGVRSSWETFETKSDLARSSFTRRSTACRSSTSSRAFSSAKSFSASPTRRTSRGPATGARASVSPAASRSTVSCISTSGPLIRAATRRANSAATAPSTATNTRIDHDPGHLPHGGRPGPLEGRRQLGADRRVGRRTRSNFCLPTRNRWWLTFAGAGGQVEPRFGVGREPVLDRRVLTGHVPAARSGCCSAYSWSRSCSRTTWVRAEQVGLEEGLVAGGDPAPQPGLGVRHVLEHGLVGVGGGQDLVGQPVDRRGGDHDPDQPGDPGRRRAGPCRRPRAGPAR